MRKQRSAAALLSFCLLIAPLVASATDFGLGVKVGTLGAGGDATLSLNDSFALRLTGSILQWDTDDEIDDVDYHLELDYTSFGALVDVHPFSNGFRFSGGLMFNDNGIVLKATPSESEEIGGNTYTPEQIGVITGNLAFDDIAPYFGIGYGRAGAGDQGLTFTIDFGLLFQSYELDLSASGLAATDPQFLRDLEEEEGDIQEELDNFKIYPVIAVGLAYRF
jgi:hypothetical protein